MHHHETVVVVRAFAWAVTMATTLFVSPTQAWEPVVCESDPQRAIHFGGNGAPWPLATRDNVTAELSAALGNAQSLWNGVEGAYDLIDIDMRAIEVCELPDESGHSLVGLDDGTCADALRFDWWGGNANGVRQYWVKDCRIVNESIYFNLHDPNSEDELGDVVLHELGHHLNYAHNWFDVSVMGYGVHINWYLTSQDQGYMRWRYPDGEALGPRVHLHRTVLLSALGEEMRPGRRSQGLAPEPMCSSGDCRAIGAGDTVSLMMTYGNTGDQNTAQAVRISMTLTNAGGASTEIGAWMAGPLPAHSYNTYVFEALVPDGMAAGEHVLRLEIDAEGTTMPQQGPSSTRFREFTGLQIVDDACVKCDLRTADAGPTEETLLPVVHEPSHTWEGSLDGRGRRSGGCRVQHAALPHSTPSMLWLTLLALVLRRRPR